jgi:hypothetical protein
MTRCPAALFLLAHDVRGRQQRDAAGRVVVPHTLVWACQRCGRDVAVTTLPAVVPRPPPPPVAVLVMPARSRATRVQR